MKGLMERYIAIDYVCAWPNLTVLADGAAYDQISSFLEQRGSIEYISSRLDAVETGKA